MREDVTGDRVDSTPRIEAFESEPRGFDALFDRYYARAVRLAFLTGAGSQTNAEEIAADALARVWLRWRTRAVDDFWPYLRVAVVNSVRSAARHARVAERHRQTQEFVTTTPGAEPTIIEREAVAAALAQLPVRQRTVLVLRYFEDLSTEQCATVMRCSAGTIKSTTSRALVALRTVMQEQGLQKDRAGGTGQ